MNQLQTANEPATSENKEVKQSEDKEQATSKEIGSKVIFYDRTYRLYR